MVQRAFTLAVCLTWAAVAAGATIDRQVQEVFPAQDGIQISVSLAYGSIRVVPGDSLEVRATLVQSVDAPSDAAAQREWQNLALDFKPDGSRSLTIDAKDRRWMQWSWEKWPPSTVVLELAVPKTCELDLLTRNGDVTVDSFHGSVRVRALDGAVFVGATEGPVTVHAGRGDVTVTSCGDSLRVTANSGSVLVGHCRGSASVQVQLGSLDIQDVAGRLDADVSGGELKAGFAYALGGDSDLKCSGDIVLTLDARSAAAVTARTSRPGQIFARDLEMKPRVGRLGDAAFDGEVNGGGVRIRARSNGGNVRILGVPDTGKKAAAGS